MLDPKQYGRWKGGFNLGMFNPAQQEQPNILEQVKAQFTPEQWSKMDPNALANTALTFGAIGALNKPQYTLPELEAFREREARRAQELGKESLRETMKAKMFYDLPGNVAKAFSGPASVYYAGMSQVPSIYNAAAQAFRPLSLTSTSVVSPGSVPSYFS